MSVVQSQVSSSQDEIVLNSYEIEGAKIVWLKKGDQCFYKIQEPELAKWERDLVIRIINEATRLYMSVDSQMEYVTKRLQEHFKDPKDFERATYWVKRIVGYGEINALLADPNVEEIECRGPGYPLSVILRNSKHCIRYVTNIVLESEEKVRAVIERLATRSNKPVSLSRPYLEFSLPEGHRVAATISTEISIPGSTFDIRKFPRKSHSILDMIRLGVLDELLAAYLWFVIEFKPFIMILGPTGSGKTSLMNALLDLVNPNWKILTIEDTPELSLNAPIWVRFVARKSIDPSAEVTLFDLARLALRYRPDLLVIGEVRGREIEALVHAAASGHGSITTFHGSRPSDVVVRVNALLDRDTAKLFLSTISMFVIMSQLPRKNEIKRKLTAIYERHAESGKSRFLLTVRWKEKEGEYSIRDPRELVKISSTVRSIIETHGLDENEVIADIGERVRFLRKAIERKLSHDELLEELRRFYGKR
ncbi:MAG: type II/IV secretion system ATPase subunit [Thermoprotei archaeon]